MSTSDDPVQRAARAGDPEARAFLAEQAYLQKFMSEEVTVEYPVRWGARDAMRSAFTNQGLTFSERRQFFRGIVWFSVTGPRREHEVLANALPHSGMLAAQYEPPTKTLLDP